MTEKKPAGQETLPELQAKVREHLQRFEELRGFL
jgi:hypothetical protein